MCATDPGASNNRRKRAHSCVMTTFATDLSGKYDLSTYIYQQDHRHNVYIRGIGVTELHTMDS